MVHIMLAIQTHMACQQQEYVYKNEWKMDGKQWNKSSKFEEKKIVKEYILIKKV